MSRSYHETFSQLKGQTKRQLDEMSTDSDSILNRLADKLHIKILVKKKRKESKVLGTNMYKKEIR
jgi:hypothetical protein